MSREDHDGPLGAVFAAQSADEVAGLYDDWAEDYDTAMAVAGYRHPTICLALLARHLPPGEGPVLDAGAGTGILGNWLGILGYENVEALDLSEGMLTVARRKGGYAKFHQLALGSELPFEDGYFSGIISAGVFTTGHVGAEGIDELIRICEPGGVIVLTIKESLWAASFAARIGLFEEDGQVEIIDGTEPYISMPGEAGTTPSRAVVLKRL